MQRSTKAMSTRFVDCVSVADASSKKSFEIHHHTRVFIALLSRSLRSLSHTHMQVANYIASRSGDLQCIVISLKDTFYEKAQSLVGIYRDQENNCSKTLSLDLSEYP
jgi:structural maintenance of chromosome 1